MVSRGQQLVRRLEKVLQSWPSDPSRKGRDLGEYLKRNYPVKFREELKQNDRKALEIVECLEKLQSNHYRRLYKRDRELGFSGESSINSTILSNENLQEMRQKSRTLWEKITGR